MAAISPWSRSNLEEMPRVDTGIAELQLKITGGRGTFNYFKLKKIDLLVKFFKNIWWISSNPNNSSIQWIPTKSETPTLPSINNFKSTYFMEVSLSSQKIHKSLLQLVFDGKLIRKPQNIHKYKKLINKFHGWMQKFMN